MILIVSGLMSKMRKMRYYTERGKGEEIGGGGSALMQKGAPFRKKIFKPQKGAWKEG